MKTMTPNPTSPQGVSAEEVARQKKEITNLLMRKISQANDLVLEREKEIEKIKADRDIFRKGFEALEETLKESAKQNKLLSDELWQLNSLPDKGGFSLEDMKASFMAGCGEEYSERETEWKLYSQSMQSKVNKGVKEGEIVYRKVSTQDRLPKEINTYFTGWKEIIIGSNYFNGKLFEDDENTDRYAQPDYWLEELPLSSLLPQQEATTKDLMRTSESSLKEDWSEIHEAFITSMKIDGDKIDISKSIYEHLQKSFDWFKNYFSKTKPLIKNWGKGVISQQEQREGSEAIKFAEWIHKNQFRQVNSMETLWGIGKQNSNHTTEELYQLFKQENK